MELKNAFRYAWQPYIVAIALIAVAAALRLWLLQTLGSRIPLLTFYPAVVVAALYGGFSAGLLGTILSGLTILYLWPVFATQPFIQDSAEWLGLVVFFITCMMISGITEAMRRARAREKQAKEQLETANIKLREEITERKRAEEALEASNKELEAFSYSVAHDLRSPLRSIDGFSKVLLEDYKDKLDNPGQDYLHRVRTAAQRMAQLIEDMLNLARVARTEMHWAKVDLSAMAKAIAAELKQSQPERKVEFVITPGLTVEGDSPLLSAALRNLLDNAYKFTGKKPRARIEFGVMEQDGKPAYFVRDDGDGFDMTYAHKLFGVFQRLHSLAEFPGTGVGLATVQRIIHRHGGRVWAEGAVGKGATFNFTL